MSENCTCDLGNDARARVRVFSNKGACVCVEEREM